jgi:hypothetical protein
MDKGAIFWAWVLWMIFVVALQHHARRYWKRTDSERYHWPRAIITSRGFQAALIWPVVLILLQFTTWKPESNTDGISIYLLLLSFIAITDLLAAMSAYWDLYEAYRKWHGWVALPPDPDKGAWIFFYFGMDRQEQMDVLDHEPDCRFNVIKRVYEDYKLIGDVKIPNPAKPLNDVVDV